MGSNSDPFRLLADAVRGVGAPFGGARRIEFLPALTGGIPTGDLDTLPDAVLEALETRSMESLAPDAPVLRWTEPGVKVIDGSFSAQELRELAYEGDGIWRLDSGQAFRLLSDRHVKPSAPGTAASRLLAALSGDGGLNSEAHALVRLDEHGQYEAICPITSYVAPAIAAAVEHRESELVREYLAGPRAKTTLLACFNSYTEEQLRFDLASLLAVREPQPGIFELRGERFAVLGLRPVTPELVEHSSYGFTLPLIDFRPPSATTH